MAITGGFGMTMDLERGTMRQWVMGRDGVKRWADNDEPCEKRPEDYDLPPYPEGEVVGPCICGSWPGGKCLRCRVVPNRDS